MSKGVGRCSQAASPLFPSRWFHDSRFKKTMQIRLITIMCLALAAAACSKSREEEIKEQQSMGAELIEDKAAMAKGAGEALKSDGKDSAAVLTEGIGNVLKGVADGVDRVESDYQISMHEGAVSKSLMADRVVPVSGAPDNKGLKVYVKSQKAYKGELQIRAFDAKGIEVGRSNKVASTLTDDDAQYVEFSFDSATPMSRVAKFILHAS
jgi:hypothetical protein